MKSIAILPGIALSITRGTFESRYPFVEHCVEFGFLNDFSSMSRRDFASSMSIAKPSIAPALPTSREAIPGFPCTNGAAARATRIRKSVGTCGSLITPSKNWSGVIVGSAEAAERAAFLRGRTLVGRALLSATAPFTRSRSPRHWYFCYFRYSVDDKRTQDARRDAHLLSAARAVLMWS